MPVSVSGATELLSKVHQTTASGGWKALQQHTEELLDKSTPGTAEHTAAITEARKANSSIPPPLTW